MAHHKIYNWILSFILVYSVGTVKLHAQSEVQLSLFLAGNTVTNGSNLNYDQFINELISLDHPYSFVYLGNYSSTSEIVSEDEIQELISVYPNKLPGNEVSMIFAMGPNEWKPGKKHVKKLIKSVEGKFGKKNVYTAQWGCPGPEEIDLNKNVTVVLIDTYWWLHTGDVRFGKCGIEDEKDIFIWLQDVLRRNEHKTVIVAGYHPVKSYGPHGGKLPLAADILFPYSIYKTKIGGRSDLTHPEYKNLSNQLHAIFNQFPNIIYASANENSLQYFKNGNYHQIISGALQNQSYVNKKKVTYGDNEPGIARLDIHKNGDVSLHFFTVEGGTKEPVFSKVLFNKVVQSKKERLSDRSNLFKAKTKVAYASKQYEGTEKYEKWMGKNYRDVWATPIEATVFDIKKERGGLKILKRGGGMQTKSIRMENKDDKQYVLRSLEKYAEGALPEVMKNTFAVDIVQDQISASNPYGALPAAVLAEYAGVLHTNPQIVYVPEDPLLKQYKADLGGGLFLYEERPAGNRKDVDSFGNSKDIVNTDEVLDKTAESEDHQVDQSAVLRARMLDLYINDWDRHDDQWRWASFKENGITVYRPIPRDRDQAFFVNQGIIPRIASKDFIMPKIQNFQPRTKNVLGLGFNSRFFDRTFLNQMEWQDWANMADTITTRMTTEAIDEAMLAFPIEVRHLCADTTRKVLIERKKYLKEMAKELYASLSEKVTVLGTSGTDLFEITRLNDKETIVAVWHLKKNGEKGKQIFNRTFVTSETKEIVCYGLDGKDNFIVTGEVTTGPIVRIIGGADKDVITDSSKVNGLRKMNKIYDLKKSTVVESQGESKKMLTNNKIVHDYNRKSFKYNVGMPLATLGYNADDGLCFGYGRAQYFQKFRRDIKSAFLLDYAIRTSAFNLKYKFESLSTTNGFDFLFDVDIQAPNYTTNYYGMGNETTNSFPDKDHLYFKVRQEQYIVGAQVQKRFGKSTWERYEDDQIAKMQSVNEHKLALGIAWKMTRTQETNSHFITNFNANGLIVNDLKEKQYCKLNLSYLYQNLDKDFMPTRGIDISANAEQFINISGNESDFSKVQGSISSYLSFSKYPRTIFAFRLGGEQVFGDYIFYEAAKLDGKTNLRGFRQTRFYGDKTLYLNSEARFKLLDFKNYMLTGEIGFLLFNDIGRVWYDNENSTKWHDGYGAGIWISPFKMAIITTTFNRSAEDNLIQFKFNYLF